MKNEKTLENELDNILSKLYDENIVVRLGKILSEKEFYIENRIYPFYSVNKNKLLYIPRIIISYDKDDYINGKNNLCKSSDIFGSNLFLSIMFKNTNSVYYQIGKVAKINKLDSMVRHYLVEMGANVAAWKFRNDEKFPDAGYYDSSVDGKDYISLIKFPVSDNDKYTMFADAKNILRRIVYYTKTHNDNANNELYTLALRIMNEITHDLI